MNELPWEHLTSALADTGIFIYWFRRDLHAQQFFRIKAFLGRFRLINPDERIAARFSELLQKYASLREHLPDVLIVATAWQKNFPLVTTNPRHFLLIQQVSVIRFTPAVASS